MTGTDDYQLPADASIGSVRLRVDSIDRVAPFYRDALGFELDRDGPNAALRAGDATVVELVADPAAPDRTPTQAGLFHVAVRVPDRAALADTLVRIRDAGVGLSGASDHLVSEALYLQDPAGNGVEVYRDRPRSSWPREADGRIGMDTLPLDLARLETDAGGNDGLPAGTDVGHVHLEVTDLAAAEGFYVDDLGLGVRARYGDQATFLAAGDYHHHVGINTWNGRSDPWGDGLGLAWFELTIPSTALLASLRTRLEARGHRVVDHDDGVGVTDPDGIPIRLGVAGG